MEFVVKKIDYNPRSPYVKNGGSNTSISTTSTSSGGDYVSKSGDETIQGKKTFISGITLSNGVSEVNLMVDSDGNLLIDKSLYSVGEVSAFGFGTSGSTSGGTGGYDRLDSFSDYTEDKQYWVLSAKLGADIWNLINNFNLNNIKDVDVTNASEGNVLVKEGLTWKAKLYDHIRRPVMSNGLIVETREQYLQRVTSAYRYVGLSVVLKKEQIINDVLVTKNVRYEFQDGITDNDFKELIYLEVADSMDDTDNSKATSLGLTKELYNQLYFRIYNIDGGNL